MDCSHSRLTLFSRHQTIKELLPQFHSMASDASYISASQEPAAAVSDASDHLPPNYGGSAWHRYPASNSLSPPPSSVVFSPPRHLNGTASSVGAPQLSPPSSKSATKRWLIAAVVVLLIIVSVLGGVLGSRSSASSASTAGSQGEPTVFGPIATSDYTSTSRSGTPTSTSTEPEFSDSLWLRNLPCIRIEYPGVMLTDFLFLYRSHIDVRVPLRLPGACVPVTPLGREVIQ